MDTSANTQKLREDILELKRQKNAIILAHNYVQGDVQDIANAMEFLIKDQYMTGQYVSPNGGIYMP